MSKYVPQVTGISRGRVFSHKPVTNCFLDLEKSINGEVNQENFEEDKVLGIRSLHERSLTETFRSRQLIWNEEETVERYPTTHTGTDVKRNDCTRHKK